MRSCFGTPLTFRSQHSGKAKDKVDTAVQKNGKALTLLTALRPDKVRLAGAIKMSDNTKASVSRVLEAARRKLLDSGTRNRLVHVNRANQRANCLNIINERADDVFSILRSNGC